MRTTSRRPAPAPASACWMISKHRRALGVGVVGALENSTQFQTSTPLWNTGGMAVADRHHRRFVTAFRRHHFETSKVIIEWFPDNNADPDFGGFAAFNWIAVEETRGAANAMPASQKGLFPQDTSARRSIASWVAEHLRGRAVVHQTVWVTVTLLLHSRPPSPRGSSRWSVTAMCPVSMIAVSGNAALRPPLASLM